MVFLGNFCTSVCSLVAFVFAAEEWAAAVLSQCPDPALCQGSLKAPDLHCLRMNLFLA